jgi:hypothetical protein
VINPDVPDLVPQDVCECITSAAREGVPKVVETLLCEVAKHA